MSSTPEDVDVLVVGAGFVGGRAAGLLADRDRRVAAVRRSPPADRDGASWIAADLTTPAGIAALPRRAGSVVFALSPVGGRDVAAYRRAHLDIPRAVVDHLDDPPTRAVLITSTAVYDVDDGSRVDEDTPAEPSRETARVLVEAEDALRDLAPTTVALRLAGIYGPGRTRLVDQVRAGEAECAPGQLTNRIHREDAARAVVHVLELPDPDPVYNVVDDHPVERCEVLAWLAETTGAPPPRVLPPEQAARSRGGNKRISNARLRASGWAPTVPSFREGYAAMLEAGSA